MGQISAFLANKEDSGKRLDIFLSEKLSISRSQAQHMIDEGLVFLNDRVATKSGSRIFENLKIEIQKESKKIEKKLIIKEDVKKENIVIPIVLETDDYLIINKPNGVLVHPTEANETNTIKDWLLSKYPKIKKVGDSPERPGIVHRLDKEASGLLVIAKTQKMFDHLKKQFQDRTVDKEYYILVHGIVKKNHDFLDFEIDRGRGGKMVARPKTDKLKLKNVDKLQEGKEALTEFFVEKQYARFALLRVKIYTGRTNQIRVHMLAYNHPVVGDMLYFNKKLNRKRDFELGRLFLHSTRLCFDDLDGERVCVEEKLPSKLADFLKILK